MILLLLDYLNVIDNYNPLSKYRDSTDEFKKKDEDIFVEKALLTTPMKHFRQFLLKKGVITSDVNMFKYTLKKIWFTFSQMDE